MLTFSSYKPDIGVRWLARELAFDAEESDSSDPDAGPRQCLDFICQHGGEQFVERKENGDVRFQSDKAKGVFEGAKLTAFRSVDIKGQI